MIRRGEVRWTGLPEPAGSEPGIRLPVVVVQYDASNRSRIRTVIAVALTSDTGLAEAPRNVLLSSRETGLPRETPSRTFPDS